MVSWHSPKDDLHLLSLTLSRDEKLLQSEDSKHERNLYYIIQTHFLPTPYNPRALAGLFISKVFVTSLEKLFIGLKELTVRKSSHVSELGALLNYFFSYNFFPRGLLLLMMRKACIGMEFAGYVYGRYSGLCKESILCLVFRD